MAAPAPSTLRVCSVVPVYCHPDWRGGGVARTATDLLIGLAQRGNDVTVVSPPFDGDHTFTLPDTRSFYDGHLRLEFNPDARTSRWGTTAHGLPERLAPILRHSDILHIHSFMSPWTTAAAKAALRAGVPYVIQDHGKLTPSILKNRGLAKRIYLALQGRKLLRSAACVIPSAEVVAKAIREWDPQIKCEACTNGLDPLEFEGPLPPRPIPQPYILFLGWLDPRKNPDLLVRAFARIAAAAPEWQLALVGPDSYGMGSSLRTLVKELMLEDRVVLPGLVRGEAKMAWLRNAGVYVLPSAGEGLSLAMLEAIACGLPCLLTPGCNYPEIEEFGAGRVLDLTEDAWAEGLRWLLTDKDARETAGRQARRLYLERHTLAKVSEDLESLLRRAVAGTAGRAR